MSFFQRLVWAFFPGEASSPREAMLVADVGQLRRELADSETHRESLRTDLALARSELTIQAREIQLLTDVLKRDLNRVRAEGDAYAAVFAGYGRPTN